MPPLSNAALAGFRTFARSWPANPRPRCASGCPRRTLETFAGNVDSFQCGTLQTARTEAAFCITVDQLRDIHALVDTGEASRAIFLPEILMNRASLSPTTTRLQALRHDLLATVELLKRRRAADIADGYIDDYVALHWLEWHGGTLRLTTTGENVCRQLS